MRRFNIILFSTCLFVLFLFIHCNNKQSSESLTDNSDQIDTLESQLLYGFNVDSFKIVGDKVKKNQFFSDLITSHGISLSLIHI